ncbi:MAG: AraC family transcriptional regulator [Planctomycetota bacterium]
MAKERAKGIRPAESRLGFFSQVASPAPFLELLSQLPSTYFFAKDTDGRFVHFNSAFLVAIGLTDAQHVLGKTDHDFFLPTVAEGYRDTDRRVMASGQPLLNHVCSVPNRAGVLRWYVETKVPLHDAHGQPLGVAGVMYDLAGAGAMLAPYERLKAAISHITDHYDEKITLAQLAALSHLSLSQFKRVFKQLFRQTPQQYLAQVRVNAACILLRETPDSLESIASQTGYYDASHFSRQFRAQMGRSPSDFRASFRAQAAN